MYNKEDDKLISQFSHYRKVLALIKHRFKLNKGEFEVLCTCFDVQQPKQKYFFAPDVVRHLTTVNETHVYRDIRSLVDKGYIKLSIKTKEQFKPNYYIIAGNGKAVLRFYTKELKQLIAS